MKVIVQSPSLNSRELVSKQKTYLDKLKSNYFSNPPPPPRPPPTHLVADLALERDLPTPHRRTSLLIWRWSRSRSAKMDSGRRPVASGSRRAKLARFGSPRILYGEWARKTMNLCCLPANSEVGLQAGKCWLSVQTNAFRALSKFLVPHESYAVVSASEI